MMELAEIVRRVTTSLLNSTNINVHSKTFFSFSYRLTSLTAAMSAHKPQLLNPSNTKRQQSALTRQQNSKVGTKVRQKKTTASRKASRINRSFEVAGTAEGFGRTPKECVINGFRSHKSKNTCLALILFSSTDR